MKKFLAIFMALTLILALGVSASAASWYQATDGSYIVIDDGSYTYSGGCDSLQSYCKGFSNFGGCRVDAYNCYGYHLYGYLAGEAVY